MSKNGKRARATRRSPVVQANADDFADAAELAYRERRAAVGCDPAAAPYVAQLREVVAVLEGNTRKRDQLVREARRRGATWPVLGEALGVSPQAVQKKYGPKS